jgi:hypothetical protein
MKEIFRWQNLRKFLSKFLPTSLLGVVLVLARELWWMKVQNGGRVVGFYKHRNQRSLKHKEYFDELADYQLLKKSASWTELA